MREHIEHESYDGMRGTTTEIFSTESGDQTLYGWRIYKANAVIAESTSLHRYKQMARLEATTAAIQARTTAREAV
uniref:Uncharacterized protein n=1 Tax=uncultured prokaryote TaxID=198431 RepID=A0A0H5Q6Q8_9ZZZZ|nr:hypothetical protein [uncultured prokaryote]